MSIKHSRVVAHIVAMSVLAVPLMVSASPSAGQANARGSINLPIETMMMSYNFTDVANPQLATFINAAYDVDLVDGSPQIELITTGYSGTTVTISIVPPSGWNLVSVTWGSGNGTYSIPAPGQTITHSFDYTVAPSGGGASKTNGGVFKIKKAGGS